MRLLDVGCGIGGASRMAAMYGAQVTGIDLSPEFVDAAQVADRTCRPRVRRATFVTTDGESMPLEVGSFDAAVMVHVGMNVPDKEALFAEVHRVLRPGGTFAVYEQVRPPTATRLPPAVGRGPTVVVRRVGRGLPAPPDGRWLHGRRGGGPHGVDSQARPLRDR